MVLNQIKGNILEFYAILAYLILLILLLWRTICFFDVKYTFKEINDCYYAINKLFLIYLDIFDYNIDKIDYIDIG